MPTLSLKRTHEHQPQFGKLPVKKKNKKERESIATNPRESTITKSLILSLAKNPKCEDWAHWATGDESQFHQFLEPLEDAEKELALKKYEEARAHWKCFACPDQTMELHKKGWISCDVCIKWSH